MGDRGRAVVRSTEDAAIGSRPIRSWLLGFAAASVVGAVAVFFTARLVFLVGLKRDVIDSAIIGVALGFVAATAVVVRARAAANPQGWVAGTTQFVRRVRRSRVSH